MEQYVGISQFSEYYCAKSNKRGSFSLSSLVGVYLILA